MADNDSGSGFKSDTLRDFVENGDDSGRVMDKADTIIMTYMSRIDRQVGIIDRLLDGDGSAEIIADKEMEIQAMQIHRDQALKDLKAIRDLCRARGWDLGRLA